MNHETEVEKNLPLVTYVLNKYFHRFDEDLFQVGCIGLIKGIKTFDSNKKTKKSTYYGKCIYNEIGMYLRRNKTMKRGAHSLMLSIDSLPSNNFAPNLYNTPTYEEILDSGENIEEDFIKKETIKEMLVNLRKLSKREQYVIVYTFGLFNKDKKTQQEIAEILKINQSSISRILKRALIKLKGMMKDEDTSLRISK